MGYQGNGSNVVGESLRSEAPAKQLSQTRIDDLVQGLGGTAKTKRLRRKQLVASVILADLAIILSAIFGFGLGYPESAIQQDQAWLLMAIIVPVYLAVALNGGAFLIKAESRRMIPVWRALAAMVYSSAGVLAFVFLARANAEVSRVVVSGVVVTSILGLAIERMLMNRWARSLVGPRPFATLCIYDQVPMNENPGFTRISAQRFGLNADPSDPDIVSRLADLSSDFDRLVIHCRPEDRESWAFLLKALSVPSEIAVPEIHALSPVSIHSRAGKTSLLINAGPLRWHQQAVKRAFDLLVVTMALPVLLPLFAIIGLIIKLDSKGPVFFRQPRIGLNNRPFQIFKFRSMRTDLLDFDGKASTERDDPRITRIGAFLRRTSIDELPQLINVLKGEMSIVGPRPHARLSRAGDRLFWEVDTAYWHRHTVKPGITGLAQVRGHRGNTFHEDHLRRRLSSDLEYVSNWSLLSDIKIIVMTFGVLKHDNAF